MSNHDQFRELSALAAMGLLSADEYLGLNQHLRECEICREAHDDFSHLVQHQLPQADAIRWRMKVATPKLNPDMELRDRFLARARSEGVDFSIEAETTKRPRVTRSAFGKWSWYWRPALAFGGLAAAIVFLSSPLQLDRHAQPAVTSDASAAKAQAQEIEDLRLQLAARDKAAELTSTQLAKMRRENSAAVQEARKLQEQLKVEQGQVESLSTELAAADSKTAGLAGVDKQQDSLIADLQSQLDKVDRQRADHLSELVTQEARIRDLNQSLQDATSNLEREEQLMAASADVRRLMGARNLHIIDVHDVNGNSRSAKAFGRVLYAEGQSLIFYAFDLVNGGQSPAKYTFQAWGQHEVESRSPRNLGTFQVDDHEQRRWVLKVNNPALLKGIDSVFVTAESLSDAKEPRGRKLLYAYIVGQPNHP